MRGTKLPLEGAKAYEGEPGTAVWNADGPRQSERTPSRPQCPGPRRNLRRRAGRRRMADPALRSGTLCALASTAAATRRSQRSRRKGSRAARDRVLLGAQDCRDRLNRDIPSVVGEALLRQQAASAVRVEHDVSVEVCKPRPERSDQVSPRGMSSPQATTSTIRKSRARQSGLSSHKRPRQAPVSFCSRAHRHRARRLPRGRKRPRPGLARTRGERDPDPLGPCRGRSVLELPEALVESDLEERAAVMPQIVIGEPVPNALPGMDGEMEVPLVQDPPDRLTNGPWGSAEKCVVRFSLFADHLGLEPLR